MKCKLLFLPILLVASLASCNNATNNSARLVEGEAYYFIDTSAAHVPTKYEKEKSDFIVFKNNLIYGWRYYSDTDNYYVSVAHLYKTYGNTLYYYQVDYRSNSERVKYGDTKIYKALEFDFNEWWNKRKDNYNDTMFYNIFGDIDYGIIKCPSDRFYATYEVANGLGFIV